METTIKKTSGTAVNAGTAKWQSAAFPAGVNLLGAALAAGVAWLFIDTDSEWYNALSIPTFAPVGLLQAVLWGVFLLIGAAAACVAVMKCCGDKRLYLMLAGLAAGVILWFVLFYTAHSVTWAVVISIALLVLGSYIVVDLHNKACLPAFIMFVALDVWLAFWVVVNLVTMLAN